MSMGMNNHIEFCMAAAILLLIVWAQMAPAFDYFSNWVGHRTWGYSVATCKIRGFERSEEL